MPITPEEQRYAPVTLLDELTSPQSQPTHEVILHTSERASNLTCPACARHAVPVDTGERTDHDA